MEIIKLHEITFDTSDAICAVTQSGESQLTLLLSSGDVIRFNIDEWAGEHLFSVKSPFTYDDGGFDLTAKSTIYTLDEIVVLVNDYKRHGYIHYPEKYYALHLHRKDYHADISCYPILLFKDETGIPHIIYSAAWNHIQIMNLDTRQVLTAAKSLIEENAEEQHIEFYKTFEEANKLPWPRPYDYFFGKLHLSPNKKRFLSAGWNWGSYDAYNAYDIDHFITSNRISDIEIAMGEHENRAVCWIDNDTIAVAYNPYTENDDNATENSPWEIRLFKIDGRKTTLQKTLQITSITLEGAAMSFDEKLNAIIALSEKIGLAIIALDGQVLLQDSNLKLYEYNIETKTLVKAENKTITIYGIKE